MNFPAGIKKVLNNKFVLYLVYFIAAMNIFGYVNVNDFNSIALFTLIAYVTSFFNKNNVVILLIAVLITNILGNTQFMIVEGLKGRKKKEGMGHKEKAQEEEAQEEEAEEEEEDDELVTGLGDDVVADSMGGRGIDKKASMEAQYENLDNILGKDGIEAMTKDTQKLIKRQGKLAESMQAMGPLLNNAQELLQGFDMEQINGLQETLKSLKQKK
tara:strand:- start:808 stop:1449 length:642 start_codon:yes stop_codon:yes gene_type:complete